MASIVASFVLLPFLVSSFGLEDFGVYMLSVAVTSYAALLDLGAGATITRMVAESREGGCGSDLATTIGSGTVFYAAVGVVAALIMVGLAAVAGSLFSVTAEQTQLLRTLLLIGAALQVWYWPATIARHALAGYERYDLISTVSVSQTLAGVAAIVAVVVLGLGPVALAAMNAILAVAASLLAIVMFLRVARSELGFRVTRVRSAEIVRSGMPVFVVQVAALINRQSTDRVVLGIFIGPAAVAVYEIAAKLSQLVTQATDLVVSAILPVASRLNAREHHDSLRALFIRGSKYTSLIVAPMVVVVACVAEPFISAWFGPGYDESVRVAQVLVMAQLFVPLYVIGDPILIGKNRYQLWVPGALALAALNIAVSILLVQRIGVVGVALGTLVAYLVELPVYARMVLRELEVSAGRWLREAALPCYPLLLVPGVVALLGVATPLAGSFLGLAAISGAAVAAYWGAAAFVALSADERRGILTTLSSRFEGGAR